MRKKIFSLVAILGGFFLWGCYPDGPTYTEDLDIVLTHHNPDYNFVAKNTYAMPNRIIKITGSLVDQEFPDSIPGIYASKIREDIVENMAAFGWERVDVSANPDVLLIPAAWESTTIVYYYDYWYWWWGGYYPSYPYYPPVYGYSYSTGTLLMTMMDPEVTDTNGNPIHQWTGALNGVLNDSFNESRMARLIDQAFEQSQYLNHNSK